MIRLEGLNDTINMKKLNERQVKILEKIPVNESISSSGVFDVLKKDVSLVTVKRDLSYLSSIGFIEKQGLGRSTTYKKTTLGNLFCPINPSDYFKVEADKREGFNSFNFDLFKDFPLSVFSKKEKETLESASKKYREKLKNLSPVVQKKELERFIIDLSWKSSKIEGNTYSLLDTEKLIKNNIPAKNHTKEETTMILNHRDAFYFTLENLSTKINIQFIEKVHYLLTKDLGVERGIRNKLVGVTGTKYRPLDNQYQIKEELESLTRLINTVKDPYSKALIALIGISYIQPFEDGNKRVSRLISNTILISNSCAPLSYRNTDEDDYKKATLVFYEKNSLEPMKKMFIDHYLFATENYLIK